MLAPGEVAPTTHEDGTLAAQATIEAAIAASRQHTTEANDTGDEGNKKKRRSRGGRRSPSTMGATPHQTKAGDQQEPPRGPSPQQRRRHPATRHGCSDSARLDGDTPTLQRLCAAGGEEECTGWAFSAAADKMYIL